MNNDKYIALATKLIHKNGRATKIRKLLTSTGWKDANDFDLAADRDVIGCFIPASGGIGADLVTEDLIARVSQVVLVAPVDIDLRLHNVVIDGSYSWKIEWVQVLQPAEKPLLYVIGLKV